MKFAKSILLASATAFVSFAATAADLPKKSAPAPVCGFGAGFMMVPGTNTCLQIGGFIRTEAFFAASNGLATYGQNNYAFGSRFFLHADARTNTSMGVVRSYGRFFNTNGSSSYWGAPGGTIAGTTGILEAFIQFAGVTGGYALSNFGLYKNDWGFQALGGLTDTRANQFGYTASLGGGLTATLAFEDRRAAYNSAVGGLGVNPFVVGAAKRPDIVANVNYTAGPLKAQANVAFVENRDISGVAKSGYAVGAGVIYSLSTATSLMVQGTYSDGANYYLSARSAGGMLNNNATNGNPGDVYFNAGALENSKGMNIGAGVNHVWNASFRTALVGGYTVQDAPNAQAYDNKTVQVALSNYYTLAPGFYVGLEALWEQSKPGQNGLAAAPVSSYSNTGLNFRLQRAF